MIAALSTVENIMATLLGVTIFWVIVTTSTFILGTIWDLITGKSKDGEQ